MVIFQNMTIFFKPTGVGGKLEATKEKVKQLSRLQQKVLHLIYENQPCTISAIARKGFVLHSSASNAVAELEGKGYIVKQKQGRETIVMIANSNIQECFNVNARRYPEQSISQPR